MQPAGLFEKAIALIDAANARDPNHVCFEDREYPAELIYGMRMTAWLAQLDPQASEQLKLAVRCQHLCRWEIPRSRYPMTRAGYRQWRTTLAAYHADKAAEILTGVGYDPTFIERVRSLIRKEKFKTDPEAQTLEDTACLTFLESDFADFASAREPRQVIDILRKTWRKMSDRGQTVAVALAAKLPKPARELIEQALSPEEPAAPPASRQADPAPPTDTPRE